MRFPEMLRVPFAVALIIAASNLVTVPLFAAPDGATPPSVPAISASLQPFVDRGELAGAVALVGRHGAIVHLDAVGKADLESGRPMQADTLFAIASMSKPISTVAALICCEEGKLSLDAPLARWLPEFDHPPMNTITLRQALSHTSGIFSDQRNVGSLAETVAKLAKQDPKFPAGSKWMYGPGVTVAGRAVEVVSGVPFDEFVVSRICRPLGMNDTRFRLPADELDRVATAYSYQAEKQVLTPFKFDTFLGQMETRSPNPSGGLYSTASDLYRFYRMLLGHGELDGVRILKPETVDEMTHSQTGDLEAGFVPGSAYGLGLGIVRHPEGVTEMLSPGSFGHGGLLGTHAWADPVNDTVMIMLIQRVNPPGGDASPYRIAFQEAAAAALNKGK